MSDDRSRGLLASLMRSKPAKPGEVYGIPGGGDSFFIGVASGVAIVLFWFLSTYLGWIKPLFLPSPVAVAGKFITTAQEGFANFTLWQHVWISALRVFGALALASVTAIPIGLAMGMNRVWRGIFDPPIEFYRPVPPLAYLPLMIIWFGIGELSKVLLIFLSIFAPVVIGARSGVKSAAIEQVHAAYSLGASRWQVLMQVILPAAMPEIITAVRIGMGVGWTTLVAAEMVAATSGVGFMVLTASQFLQTDIVIMGIVIIAAIAYAFDLAMRWLERRLVPWKGRM